MARNAQIKLSDVATSRVNNLNFMRFVAALMVIVSHCYSVVLGGDAGSYLLKLTGDRLSPGGVSVGVFFLFGGFLIRGFSLLSACNARNTKPPAMRVENTFCFAN